MAGVTAGEGNSQPASMLKIKLHVKYIRSLMLYLPLLLGNTPTGYHVLGGVDQASTAVIILS
jgi:hypothetical protein